MFRRLFALWSLVSLLFASGPVFAGGAGLLTSLVEQGAVQTLQLSEVLDVSISPDTKTPTSTPDDLASSLVEAEPSLDPMDWPEGIELLGILARASQLSHAIVPHTRHAMPSPCLATLQRPPSARA